MVSVLVSSWETWSPAMERVRPSAAWLRISVLADATKKKRNPKNPTVVLSSGKLGSCLFSKEFLFHHKLEEI